MFFDEERAPAGALDRTVDAIRGQFGNGAIRRGSLLERDGSGRAPPEV